jgi:2-polyprenyl-3-methyl-5-hydroxy-6-metoxy-1,4-benzoquinol methylase
MLKNPTKKCNICGCFNLTIEKLIVQPDRFEQFAIKKWGLEFNPRQWLLCNDCRVVTQYIPPNIQTHLEKIANQYYAIDLPGVDLIERQSKILNLPKELSDNQNRIQRVERIITKYRASKSGEVTKIKMLDFGSGLGVFPIALLASEIWRNTVPEIHLVETDALAIKLLETIPNAILHDGNFQPDDHVGYNFVFMVKVLEHMKDPLQWVSRMLKTLELSGVLYVEVPSSESLRLEPHDNSLGSLHFNLFNRYAFQKICELTNSNLVEFDEFVEPSGKLTCYCLIANN